MAAAPFLRFTKAHAYGNDFLLLQSRVEDAALPGLARALCDRHRGVGADGLIRYDTTAAGARMRLVNADGSWSELSGNGVRCLAALVARDAGLDPSATVRIETDAGEKRLHLRAREGTRYEFLTEMGPPVDLRQLQIPVLGETLTASVLRMGNPQCVVIGPLPDEERFRTLGAALAVHPMFPSGTNVEFAQVEAPDRIRILIWERGVGPTTSSGTGSSASAVAAAAHGGAARALDVVAPGGTQRVEWRETGVYLTGWAEIVFAGDWLAAVAEPREAESPT